LKNGKFWAKVIASRGIMDRLVGAAPGRGGGGGHTDEAKEESEEESEDDVLKEG